MITITIKGFSNLKSDNPRDGFWNELSGEKLRDEEILGFENAVSEQFPSKLKERLEKVVKETIAGTGYPTTEIGGYAVDTSFLQSTQTILEDVWESRKESVYSKFKERTLCSKIPSTLNWDNLTFVVDQRNFLYSSFTILVDLGIESFKVLKTIFDGSPELLSAFLNAFVPFAFAEIDYPTDNLNIINNYINHGSFEIQSDEIVTNYLLGNLTKKDNSNKIEVHHLLEGKTNRAIWLISNISLKISIMLCFGLILFLFKVHREQANKNQNVQILFFNNFVSHMKVNDKVDSVAASRMLEVLVEEFDLAK